MAFEKVDTDVLRNAVGWYRKNGHNLHAFPRKHRKVWMAAGFAGDGRDTANEAVFLASDEARFITGTEIVIAGGMSARCD